MPRIDEVREPGYYFIIPKKNLPEHKVIEVSPDYNKNKYVPEIEPRQVMAFKDANVFSYDLPEPKLIPPQVTQPEGDFKYVMIDKDRELVEDSPVKQVAPNENVDFIPSNDIAMVKPMVLEGHDDKGIAMVKPMVSPSQASKGIAMVKPMVLEGHEDKGIAMVKPMVLEGNSSKDIAMVKPMSLEGHEDKGIAMVKPMYQEELVPSDKTATKWSKGVVLSKYPMVQGSDLSTSLSNHFKDTIERMTTGFVDDIKSWMSQKREDLKKEFHNFVSKTMRDYENAIMDPVNTLVKNAIQNPLGTLNDFPRNIKSAFNEIGGGLLDTTYDAGVTVANKAIDTLNTGVEVINKVDAFFGTSDKVPALKVIPRLPSSTELKNRALMKGGSLAKMGNSNFDVAAFKAKAEEGKINRDALIAQGSTPGGELLPDDFSLWAGTPLWFTLADDNVLIDEKNPPIILDNTGKETIDRDKDWRRKGEKSYNFMGNREGPFISVMEGIYREHLGFQAQPDIYCDIKIEPCKYKTNSLVYRPPAYPVAQLGDYMVADFNVQHMSMNTEEMWNLGAYGSIPLVVNYTLPSSLSIRFVGDANLLTLKWLTAYQEYMSGYNLNPHVMRPYKMCCQKITLYALTFYGEVVHAKTFLAYPIFKDDYSMLGSNGVKHFDVEWIVVGLQEFTASTASMLNLKTADTSTTADDAPADEQEAVTGELDTASASSVSAALNTNSTNIQQGAYTDADVSSVDAHTDKFLDTVKNSASVANKLKQIADNDTVKALAEKAGLSKVLGDISKIADLDIIIRTNCNYLVCAYTNHVASPSYGKTGIPYNSTDLDAAYQGKAVLEARFNECDNLAQKRANEYVESLLKKGVSRDNIKVILASCDGIPGMNHYIKGTAMEGSFYLGGIYAYTKAECEIESGDGNSAGLSKNRRVDLIYFDDFVADCPDAIDGMMGTGSSDARGDDSKLSILWNRIPKVSYGRDACWGVNVTNRFPTSSSKNTDLGINGFASSAGTGKTPVDKPTNADKYAEEQEAIQETKELIELGSGTEEQIDLVKANYAKSEQTKQSNSSDLLSTENLSYIRETGNFQSKSISSIQAFKANVTDKIWFNTHFGLKNRAQFIANEQPKLYSYFNSDNTPAFSSVDAYLSAIGMLPKDANGTTFFPVLSPGTLDTTRQLWLQSKARKWGFFWWYRADTDTLHWYQIC